MNISDETIAELKERAMRGTLRTNLLELFYLLEDIQAGRARIRELEAALENRIDPVEEAANLAGVPLPGSVLIARERARQVVQEGWDTKHDDAHSDQSLAWAATCYAAPKQIFREQGHYTFKDPWPWDRGWDKRAKHDRLRQLTIAGALIAAEIDRLQRVQLQDATGATNP